MTPLDTATRDMLSDSIKVEDIFILFVSMSILVWWFGLIFGKAFWVSR